MDEFIIDFNPSIINSKIKSDFILYEEKDNEYNHMGIALDKKSGKRYVETFFREATDRYVNGQKVLKVREFALYDKNEKVIVRDRHSL